MGGERCWIAQSKQACSPGFDSQRSQNLIRGKIFNVAEVNQRRWLEESGLRLENVNQTHLVLASGKPVLQKVKVVLESTIDIYCGTDMN